jgi:glutathione S-transferase
MLTLYHAQNTRSVRVRWLLEEMGVKYEIRKINFMKGEAQGPEYLAVHPMGKLPSIIDDGQTIFESGAIIQYLLEKTGNKDFEPSPGSKDRAAYLQWFHFAEATFAMYLSLIAAHAFLLPKEQRSESVAAGAREKANECLALLDRHLEGKEYLVGGKFTAADIMVGYSLLLCSLFGLLPGNHSNVAAYYERLSARPAFQKANAD